MGSVITIAGEKLFAAKAQANQQLDIDTFIFANVPGQDPTAPIDREEPLPPQAQIVHQQVVQQVGRINENVVVYSTVLDSVTGPFEFNWVGLYSSVNQTLVAINHVPTVAKTVTGPGVAGNTLNRNFGIEYSGIADLTGITVAPETWQLDFTARLSGMDELTRQLAADMNGKDWFIGEGFKVVPSATANSFLVTPGVGYVSGLRIELEQEHIINVQTYPQFVYVDAWFAGDTSSMWKPNVKLTVSAEQLDDYVDGNGTNHYICKLATVTENDQVDDLRTVGNNVEQLRKDMASEDESKQSKLIKYRKRTQYEKNKDIRDARDFGAKLTASPEVNYDALIAMKHEAVSDGDNELNIRELYTISQGIVLDSEALCIKTAGRYKSGLILDPESTSDCLVEISSRLCEVEGFYLNSQGKTGLRIKGGQLSSVRNLICKGNQIGLHHIDGNSCEIIGYFAESNDFGYVAEAVADGNVNGNTIIGRAYNNIVGWEIRENSAPVGSGNAFMHNFLRWTAESNTIGIREIAGNSKSRYNFGFLYAEGNTKLTQGYTNKNFDLLNENPNWWALANPNNEEMLNDGKAIGVMTSGSSIFNVDNEQNKFKSIDLNEQVSLDGDAVEVYYIKNTSGLTKQVYLQFLTYARVNSKRTIYKFDNTNGFTLLAPDGFTLVGDVGITYGAFCSNQVEQIDLRKISETECLIQCIKKES
ncbi:phage tail protein [Shewanella algae]|uniref:phage tail-collar fiber domain-containing protein n=1 Tax=Shewanella algae TaxID=38313 RepID=UPI0031F53AC3